MTTAPTLVPTLLVEPMYFVLADFGSLGAEYVARDPIHMDWMTTVSHLAAGEWRDPRQVIEVDLQKGTARDVTEKAMLAAELVRSGVPVTSC